MHLLYVVDFDVQATGEGTSAYDLVVGHLVEWLNRGTDLAVSAEDLSRPGTLALPVAVLGDLVSGARTATWETVEAGDDRALRTTVLQTLDSGVELSTRVTLSQVGGRVGFRVGISREFLGGALTPVGHTNVYQPGIVGLVARDERLSLWIGGQRIDERFARVRDATEASAVLAALETPNRLPVLLVHARTQAGWDAAFAAAGKLIGLVRVVTVNLVARSAIEAALPRHAVPFGGAHLVWSDVAARGVDVAAESIQAMDRDVLRDKLMPRLAPVAALARGTDQGWRQARQTLQSVARENADTRLRLAQESADSEEQRLALEEKVATLEAEVQETDELANSYAREVEELEAKVVATEDLRTQAEDLQAQVDYWKGQYLLRVRVDDHQWRSSRQGR